MFTFDLEGLGRIILTGIMAYIGLIIMLRVAGKRTLSQLNAFDLVITVSIGSVLATTMMDKAVSIFDGLVTFLVLILLQWIFSKTTTKTDKIGKMIRGQASILYYRGSYYTEAMEKERVEKEEIIQAARKEGMSTMDEVEAVILESNGQLSVLSKSKGDGKTTIPE